ncbi:hypothetical protein GJ496_008271 [Pomphorhynchus laevis]|nr:hypothetical protein GJ496_008271 [Pomphorhynchus laevis]
MSTLISTLLAACGHRNCLNKVRQSTQRPLWMRAIQRALIFLSKRFRFDISVRREYVLLRQFYTHLNVMWRKTKLHAEEQKRIYLAEKAPWILLRRNNSGTSQIPLSAWVDHEKRAQLLRAAKMLRTLSHQHGLYFPAELSPDECEVQYRLSFERRFCKVNILINTLQSETCSPSLSTAPAASVSTTAAGRQQDGCISSRRSTVHRTKHTVFKSSRFRVKQLDTPSTDIDEITTDLNRIKFKRQNKRVIRADRKRQQRLIKDLRHSDDTDGVHFSSIVESTSNKNPASTSQDDASKRRHDRNSTRKWHP